MPRGHAKDEAAKSAKLSIALMGNQNIRGKHFKRSIEDNRKKSERQNGKPSNALGKHINVREKNPNWILDRSLLVKKQLRNDSAYKEWRMSVWQRDNFKCKIMNSDCLGKIEAHHILGWKDHPELRYQSNNGITLCHAHHPRMRAEEKRLSPYFQDLVSVSNELFCLH